MLSVIFRTKKDTNETQIVGQTTKEDKELEQIKRTLAKDGGNVGKNKQGDFFSETYLVESADKDIVRDAFGTTLDI